MNTLRFHKKTIYEALGREPVHPFPARMAPGIALQAMSHSCESLRVLDPMMGSGTVLAMARHLGHRAVGYDIDPLAVLISKVWTKALDREEIRYRASRALNSARRTFESLAQRDAYPAGSDQATREFIRYWFDGYARRQLASLSFAIRRTQCSRTRDALWCAFSRLIIVKQAGASLALDLSHSRPHRAFDRAPTKPFNKFLNAVDRVLDNGIDSAQSHRGPEPQIHLGDARSLRLPRESVDLVLTSPPYLNAIDYIRCSKFSLVWMGYSIDELQNIRSSSVGTEVGSNASLEDPEIRNIIESLKVRDSMSPRHQRILARYIDDMRQAMREVSRVLSQPGTAVYVIGENTLRGTYIQTSAIVSKLANVVGLKRQQRRTRDLPSNRRYLPPPVAQQHVGQLQSRMRREVVLTFSK